MSDLFAPPGGWRVRILDHSAAAGEEVLEEVAGFPTLMQANAFARRYVCDSVERCRLPGAAAADVLAAWRAWGEDASVPDSGGLGWDSAADLPGFAARPAAAEDRDWRALDPRRYADPDSDEEGTGEEDNR